MDERVRQIHLLAGKEYGREATCRNGEKINYRTEEAAVQAADAMTQKHGRPLEGYPCYWCDGWHVGRKMTSEEVAEFEKMIA